MGQIVELTLQQAPWDLLLEADPNRKQISTYLSKSLLFGYQLDGQIIGVVVVEPNHSILEAEIKNIAVNPSFEGQGIGRQLLSYVIDWSRNNHYKTLFISTGNSSIRQLKIYQKVGFEIFDLDKDFFIRNYPKPIFEDGIQCTTLIKLKMSL